MSEKAIELYNRMRLAGVEENRFTFMFVLKAYSSRRCCSEGRVAHGKVLKMGFDSDVYVNNAMIHFYARCGDVGSARKLFDEMPMSSLVNWNTLVLACFGCGDVESGRKVFDEMLRGTRSRSKGISLHNFPEGMAVFLGSMKIGDNKSEQCRVGATQEDMEEETEVIFDMEKLVQGKC